MQAISNMSLGARTELSRAVQQSSCRPRARNVVMAAHQSNKQQPQMAVAAAAALLLTSVGLRAAQVCEIIWQPDRVPARICSLRGTDFAGVAGMYRKLLFLQCNPLTLRRWFQRCFSFNIARARGLPADNQRV